MTGSPLYLIERSDFFERSLKKLAKAYRQEGKEVLIDAISGLTEDPFPLKSRAEPLPRKTLLPEGWTFHKLEIWVTKGAAGQVRLMYLVNEADRVIKLLWVYNHEQFAKRPEDRDLSNVIDLGLNSEPEDPNEIV